MDATIPSVPEGAPQEEGAGTCHHYPLCSGPEELGRYCHLHNDLYPAVREATWNANAEFGTMYRQICFVPACSLHLTPGPAVWALCAWVHPAHQETLDTGDRVHIILMLAAFDEGSQAGGIQWDLGIAAIVWLQPGVLQASGCRWPSPEVFLEDNIDEIPGGMTHIGEVLQREAEIYSAHIDASFLFAFIQEWRDTT